MNERLEAIDEYYTNLEYRIDKEEGLMKIYALAKEFIDVDNVSERFSKVASVIEKNSSLFKAVFEDTDAITTTIKYLNYFSMKFELGDEYEILLNEYEKISIEKIVPLVVFTILEICGWKMRIFLDHAFMKNSTLTKSLKDVCLNISQALVFEEENYNNEIILMRDSDLYAVIRYLKNKISITPANKIWVQEPIKDKFLWLMKEYLKEDSFAICTFRTKEELLTASRPNKMNIVCIWTEDIVFAKNLAMSLNRDIVFINTCTDVHGGIVLLPCKQVINRTLPRCILDLPIKQLNVQKSSINNLFYDGMWQRPIKNTYWIHNNSQWANATSDDVYKCVNSAEEGFKIWSNKSVTCRMQILSKFASILESNGKSGLADIMSKWIKFSMYIYENFLSCSQSEGLEVTKIRIPKGVIILKEEDELVLFHRLIQILMFGNSVIVINSCGLVSYCNMFSMSKIPPGVINLLSSENIKEIEFYLCKTDYSRYESDLFSKNPMETYIKLTELKQIIVPLK